jgi:lipopolysaccharide export system protein LptA
MRSLILCAFLLLNLAIRQMPAQGLSAPTLASPKPNPKKNTAKDATKDPLKAAVAGKKSDTPKELITTEIYAEHAFFDSAKSIGIFTGRVIVKDPRFNVQSDKLTIYMTKGGTEQKQKGEAQPQDGTGQTPDAQASPPPQQTLEKAVAEGNVGVVRDQPGENGGPPQHSVGRGDTAIYTTSDGNVELRGSPRVQNGLNTHVATSPDTVMVMTQNGQLTTTGPSRTEIKQEPKASPSPSGSPAPAASASPTPKPKS